MKNKSPIINYKKGDIIYITDIVDENNQYIEHESFICADKDKYIETWYLGMIINNSNIIDVSLKPRSIYTIDDKSTINIIGNIDAQIIDLFNKINKENI